METWLQDIRYAVRSLRRTPGYTITVIAVMALAIGVNSMMVSVLQPFLRVDMGIPAADRVMYVDMTNASNNDGDLGLSGPDLLDYRAQAKSFQAIGGYLNTTVYPVYGKEPEREQALLCSASLAGALGVQPMIGHWFTPAEEVYGQNFSSIVLSHDVWTRRFGADRHVLGRTMRVSGRVRTIIGVMPPGFRFPETTAYFLPLAIDLKNESRGQHYLACIGRLRDGVTAAAAASEMRGIAKHLEQQYPETNGGMTTVTQPFAEFTVRNIRPIMSILTLAVLFVLLIACANVANLTLARGAARHRELGIRLALGASRARLVRQLLTESLVLAIAGGVLGLLLGHWGLELTLAAIPEQLPYWMHFGTDLPVTLATLAVAALTGAVFGLAPALQITAGELVAPLRESSTSGGDSPSRARLRQGLVVAEVALALVLLVGAGLMTRSFLKLTEKHAQVRAEGVLTARVTLPVAKYPEDPQRVRFIHDYVAQVASLAGVTSASAVSDLPLGHSSWSMVIAREGHDDSRSERRPVINFASCLPGYFRTMGIALHRGRDIAATDVAGAPRVALVNESAARRLWPGEDPLGKRFDFGKDDTLGWITVVGVVADVQQNLHNQRIEQMYVPHSQFGQQTMSVIVRTAGPPAAMAEPMRRLLVARDPDLPLYDVATMPQFLREALWEPRLYASLMLLFSLLALVIAGLGIHGVMAYTVAQRTREIGIRMALGAARADVQRMVVVQAFRLVAIGGTIGIVVALLTTRFMSSQLQGVSATDPPTFMTVAVLLAISGVFAAWLPARRATLIDPMLALRAE